MRTANPQAIHICNSHEPTLDQKLQKSMALPTLRKMLTKFEIMNETIKHESTTRNIKNWAESGKYKRINIK